jgi:hypothetical protein
MLNIFCDEYIFNFIGGLAITSKFDTKKAFKDAYHLQDIRFAVTLMKREPDEKVFQRLDDIQYISQISTADRNVKRNIFNLNNSLFFLLGNSWRK